MDHDLVVVYVAIGGCMFFLLWVIGTLMGGGPAMVLVDYGTKAQTAVMVVILLVCTSILWPPCFIPYLMLNNPPSG